MALRDLSNLPRADVDALREIVRHGTFDEALNAAGRLRAIIDAQPLKTSDTPASLPTFPIRHRVGRLRGSKVVNGRVVPPPVPVDLTQSRVEVVVTPAMAKLLDEPAIRDWWRARGF